VAQLRLREEAARDVLLLRAIEGEDPQCAVFTREDRQYATASALQTEHLGENGDSVFLASRARVALDRLIGRYPLLQRARTVGTWPRWLNLALPAAALTLGLLSNRVEGDTFNILAFPLLGMLAWNFGVYLLLLLRAIHQAIGGSTAKGKVPAWADRALRPAAARLAGHPALERAVTRFGHDWVSAAAPITRARARRTLHLSAALLAFGIIAGMLIRARYTAEYTAGWAGTWTGAENEVAALLRIVLGPASAITGIILPTAERLRDLRGTAENAGDWLILWTVTGTLFVIVPRLLLAGWEGTRSAVLSRRVGVERNFYVRSLMRNALGRPSAARVVPYSFDLDEQSGDTLKTLLRQALGEKSSVKVDSAVPYGEEDAWMEREGSSLTNADHLILLFSIGSTPEAENHGAFVQGVQSRLGEQAHLTVLLDDSSFLRKLRGQPSAERRLKERLDAWNAVLAGTRLKPLRVNLSSDADPAAAHDLEQAFFGNAAPA
jgi:hypothetical protein